MPRSSRTTPAPTAPVLTPHLTGWVKPDLKSEERLAKYSTTGDVLGYRRCRRQYGIFKARGFEASADTQLYFGTLMHDVLDQIHRNFQSTATIPDNSEIADMVEQAHERLRRSGIRPYNPKEQKARAIKLIDRFVTLVGPKFFPHIKETEYRLERELSTPTGRPYILHGIVDVLSGAIAHDLNLNYVTKPTDMEIWDYKSGKMPPNGSSLRDDYAYQMHVYAELYKQQTGKHPARCVLVFVGDLDDDDKWNRDKTIRNFTNIFLPVPPTINDIEDAMAVFNTTVENIEQEKALPFSNQWEAPAHDVDDQTCRACDLRYNCPKYPTGAGDMKKGL